jgi:hypothetical protein
LRLPDYLRSEELPAPKTTGAVPPPHAGGRAPEFRNLPGQVDWRAALTAIAVVAGVGAMLVVAGLASTVASTLSFVWTISASVVVLGLYAKARPQAWMDARTGMRIGTATGVMLVAAMGLSVATAGVVLRYGTHGLGALDTEVTQDFAAMRQQMEARMHDQGQPPDVQQKLLGFMAAPESRAGVALFYGGLLGGIVVLLSAGGGAFAGMLRASQSPRAGSDKGLRPGD